MRSEFDERMAILPIHFDVPDHVLPLDTFVETAEQTAALLQALGDELAGGKLVLQIVVIPPAEGSFKTRLGIIVKGGIGLGIAWTFIESDIGKAFVKGITQHEPAYWAEQVGQNIRETAIEMHSESSREIEEQELCGAVADMMVDLTKSFLQAETSVLKSNGITIGRYRRAYQARNQFYDACEGTRGLEGIGFNENPTFPIQRNDFIRLQVPIPPKEDDPETWNAGLTTLKVTSPNWNRDDKHRHWKGRDPKGRDRHFRIDDEHFWLLVRQEKLNPHIIDTIEVQWAYQGTHENPRCAKVIRVLKYNDETLAKPLGDDALEAILAKFIHIEDDHPDLFSND